MKFRDGESPSSRYRAASRCFQMNGKWYFATREGIDVGPFPSREAAEVGVEKLIAMIRGVTDPKEVHKLIEGFATLKGEWQYRP